MQEENFIMLDAILHYVLLISLWVWAVIRLDMDMLQRGY